MIGISRIEKESSHCMPLQTFVVLLDSVNIAHLLAKQHSIWLTTQREVRSGLELNHHLSVDQFRILVCTC